MIQIQILPREIPFFFPSIIPASPSSPASKSSFSISLPPLFIYAAMVDISDKTARTATVFNSHGRERAREQERKWERERERERKRAIVYFFGLRGVASIFRWRRAKTSGTDKRGLQIVPLLPKMETPLNILCRRWRDIDWFFAPFPRSFN